MRDIRPLLSFLFREFYTLHVQKTYGRAAQKWSLFVVLR
jgi:hypothetical protein